MSSFLFSQLKFFELYVRTCPAMFFSFGRSSKLSQPFSGDVPHFWERAICDEVRLDNTCNLSRSEMIRTSCGRSLRANLNSNQEIKARSVVVVSLQITTNREKN